ncbi:MAG: AIM24 family protein [Candidatus Saliniplasma sp.]
MEGDNLEVVTIEQDSQDMIYGEAGTMAFMSGNVQMNTEASGEGYYVGGLVGFNREGTVTNSFWDIETTGLDKSDNVTGKYTVEMVKENTFTDAGWDFDEIWDIIEGETYPFLQWQEEDTYLFPPELVEDDDEDDDTPGFTSLLLLMSSIIVVAIYRKKCRKR